jgi:nucleoside-diphosphate-sugar epimerase
MGNAVGDGFIIDKDDLILVTGATGFIGSRLVWNLLDRGFRNLRCFTRPSSGMAGLENLWGHRRAGRRVEVVTGNLLSPEDCARATENVAVIFHLAAGRGEKSFPDAFMNSVVATRNLLEASRRNQCLLRFVNVSSFTVYTNEKKPRWRLLDESCPVDNHPELRGEAYTFAKVKQEEIVIGYGAKFGIPYVIVRPGVVYGPGNESITGRVGVDTFGLFLHLGGSNVIPLTYVDNCADAIVLSGLKNGVDCEVFNVVDNELPSGREFLRLYKKNVRRFRSIYVPHCLSFLLCYLWERYASWSEGQLPPVFNRRRWHANWKKTYYSNEKLKKRLAWAQGVPTQEGLKRYFESCRNRGLNA